MSVNELNSITQNLKTKDFNSTFSGFTFFSRYCSTNHYNDNADFIVAIEDDKVVGILKYSIKICQGLWGELKDGELYTSMHYIDVSEKYKGKGVGRELIKFFNTIVDRNIPLLISEEWGEGQIVGTHRMFGKYMENIDVIFNTRYGHQRSKQYSTYSAMYSEFYV